MIWAPYFEHSTIISNTCVVRYAYICADVAIIGDYCYARCHPMSPAAPYYRCSQHNRSWPHVYARRVVSATCEPTASRLFRQTSSPQTIKRQHDDTMALRLLVLAAIVAQAAASHVYIIEDGLCFESPDGCSQHNIDCLHFSQHELTRAPGTQSCGRSRRFPPHGQSLALT